MGVYRPGTLDVFANDARGTSRRQRVADEANLPSGSQPYQTTLKVRQGKADIDTARQVSQDAEDKASRALQTTVEQSLAIDRLGSRVGAVEDTLSGIGMSAVLSANASGFGLADVPGWQTLASVTVPTADGMRILLGISATGVAVSHGPSALQLRLAVNGKKICESVAAYGGDTRIMPGSLTGPHNIALNGYTQADPGDTATLEAMAATPSDWPKDKDSTVDLFIRADYRPDGKTKEAS